MTTGRTRQKRVLKNAIPLKEGNGEGAGSSGHGNRDRSQMDCLSPSCPHCRHHMQAGQASSEGGSSSRANAIPGVHVASLHQTHRGEKRHIHAIAQKHAQAGLLSGSPARHPAPQGGRCSGGCRKHGGGSLAKETI